jgi:transposase
MLPRSFSAQDQLLIPGPAWMLPAQDRYRLFAQKVLPVLVKARAALAELYCADNGRRGIEPVLLLALSVLQFWERVPDAQAVALLNWHLGWAFAVGWEMGRELFHPCVLSRFRQRLLKHKKGALAFEALVKELVECGLIHPQSSRRLDSTFVLGLISHMGRLECLRETLRLALEELSDRQAPTQGRPSFWPLWWERYVEHQLDFRAQAAVLQAKLRQTGEDIMNLLAWVDLSPTAAWASGAKVQLLRRVLAEHFELPKPSTPAAVPLPKEKTPAGAVKNPHDPEAQWAKKGSGAQKKEVVGFKVQVCETAQEQPLAKGQPTQQFLTAIETQPATASDQRGMDQVHQAEARQNLPPAPTQYVDAAYICGAKLAQAKAQGRELIGPAPVPPGKEGRFSTAEFDIRFDPLQARCPAGQLHVNYVQWQDTEMGGTATRFDWAHHCQTCSLRAQCVSPKQTSRSLAIGPHHELLQARRREQTTPPFRQRCQNRNALEGTQSELVRAHGLRQARYRGVEKVRLQNYFIGTACNAKRWIRLLQWRARQTTPAVGTEPVKKLSR